MSGGVKFSDFFAFPEFLLFSKSRHPRQTQVCLGVDNFFFPKEYRRKGTPVDIGFSKPVLPPQKIVLLL